MRRCPYRYKKLLCCICSNTFVHHFVLFCCLEDEIYEVLDPRWDFEIKGLISQHQYQIQTENFYVWYGVLGAWKRKPLKTGFKVFFFFKRICSKCECKNSVTSSANVQSIGMHEFIYKVTSPTTGLACIIQRFSHFWRSVWTEIILTTPLSGCKTKTQFCCTLLCKCTLKRDHFDFWEKIFKQSHTYLLYRASNSDFKDTKAYNLNTDSYSSH